MKQLSEITINYSSRVKISSLPKVVSSKDAEVQFRAIWSDKMQYLEEVYILLLNRANKVLGFTKVSSGGTSATVVDTKIIFQSALKANASSIIMGHNHPSGNLQPSEQDIKLTKGLKDAGKTMEIPLLDHLIITQEGYYSFADEGIF